MNTQATVPRASVIKTYRDFVIESRASLIEFCAPIMALGAFGVSIYVNTCTLFDTKRYMEVQGVPQSQSAFNPRRHQVEKTQTNAF